MAHPTVDELYASYDKLASDSVSENEKLDAYKLVIAGTKGGDKEKRLASQFIARFAKGFSSLQEESFNCILDLCDDDDVNIRKQAVHDLLSFCKHTRSYVPRVADVLVQLFQTDDSQELHLVSLALSQLLAMDAKPALVGIFNQLLAVNPESSRENVLKFLAERLKNLSEDILTSELESFVVEQTNKVLRDVSEEEFQLLISILSSLRCMSSLIGRQKLVHMITEQALQAVPDFNIRDPASVAQIRESCKQATLFLSKNVHAFDLYIYTLTKVLPQLSEFSDDNCDDRLSLLRSAAELAVYPSPEVANIPNEKFEKFLSSVYELLMKFLPDVPIGAEDANTVTNDSETSTYHTKKLNTENLKLSELEAVLYLTCHLGKYKPQFFGGFSSEVEKDSEPVKIGLERLRIMRPRLQYLSQVAQEYAQSLANQMTSDVQAEDKKLKVLAHKLVTNIQTLVRSFFHNPPSFKNTLVTLSWLQNTTQSPLSKRTAPVELESAQIKNRRPRLDQQIYTPPVGRWSRTLPSSRGR